MREMRQENVDQELAAKVAEGFKGCDRGEVHA